MLMIRLMPWASIIAKPNRIASMHLTLVLLFASFAPFFIIHRHLRRFNDPFPHFRERYLIRLLMSQRAMANSDIPLIPSDGFLSLK